MLSASFSLDLKSTVTRRIAMTAMVGQARTAADLAKLPRLDLTGVELMFSAYRPGVTMPEFALVSSKGQIEIPSPTDGTFTLVFQPANYARTGYRGMFDVVATFPSGDCIELCRGNLSVTAFGTSTASASKGVFGGNTVMLSEDSIALLVDGRGPKGDPGAPGPPGPGLEELDINFSLIYQISKL